ncbi:HD domain-containing protein [Candidatus Pacearchaeota archaeon]|nr:HD domain-containing protein [Candidatus Pacearchaeota archaeon]
MESKNLDQRLQEEFEELHLQQPQRSRIVNFLNVVRQRDEATYEHSLRVGALGLDISKYMHLDPKVLFYAGTLHDLGKTLVDGDILRKTEGFNDADMKIIKKHPLDGYRFLKGLNDFTAEVVVRGHSHQKDSYPKYIPKPKVPFSDNTKLMINFYSRLLGLTDFYDALTHRTNDKFGKNLSSQEKKELFLLYNQDQRELIEKLVKEGIFQFLDPLIGGASSRYWEAASRIALSDGSDMEMKQKRISELGLPGLDLLVLCNKGNKQEIDEKSLETRDFITKYGSVVAWASSGLDKVDKPGVKSYEELDNIVKSLDREKDYKILAWSMIEGALDSYIGNAVSDGAGKLLIEFYKKPYFTDITALSRGKCESNLLSHLYVENFDDIIITPNNIPELDVNYLTNELSGLKGYFGFIKGIKKGERGIYFVQHEITNPFLDLLKGTDKYHFDLEKRVLSKYKH